MLWGCKNSETAYSALKMEEANIFNLSEVTDYKKVRKYVRSHILADYKKVRKYVRAHILVLTLERCTCILGLARIAKLHTQLWKCTIKVKTIKRIERKYVRAYILVTTLETCTCNGVNLSTVSLHTACRYLKFTSKVPKATCFFFNFNLVERRVEMKGEEVWLGHPPNHYMEVGVQSNILYWKTAMGGVVGGIQSRNFKGVGPEHAQASARQCLGAWSSVDISNHNSNILCHVISCCYDTYIFSC